MNPIAPSPHALSVTLPLAAIVPFKKPYSMNSKRYQAIRASIKELGLVEPLVVVAHQGSPTKFRVVDGHLRFLALKELDQTHAECVVIRQKEVP